jgi:sugar O-acyltransferase (sialic acid O-acetyltransferase NeuD family)
MKRIVIWGCGGFAREVAMLAEQVGLEVVAFLDERPEMKGRVIDDVRVAGTLDDIRHLRPSISIVTAGVGDPALKQRFAAATEQAGFKHCHPIVHPQVYVSKRSSIGPGSVVCAGVVLTVNVRIGSHVIVNLCSTIGHDVQIGDYATISPGVNISGNVELGDRTYLGTNAAIRERVRIGAGSVIGGGAFVRDDVPSDSLYAGVPAELKKRLA